MKPCYGNTKHGFKPLSDPYAKYLPETDTQDQRGYNYKSRKEVNPGVSYSTLFCPGCGTVVEVISQNTTDKELHNHDTEKEINQQTQDASGTSIDSPTIPSSDQTQTSAISVS